MKSDRNLCTDLALGALAGAAATWIMGKTTSYLYEKEDTQARKREDQARGDKTAYEVAAEKAAHFAYSQLSEDERKKLGGDPLVRRHRLGRALCAAAPPAGRRGSRPRAGDRRALRHRCLAVARRGGKPRARAHSRTSRVPLAGPRARPRRASRPGSGYRRGPAGRRSRSLSLTSALRPAAPR